tara:strand:+ start:4368 stop:5327 length:960 start_codon:yes stop_codon:yes gene_type:complete
MNSIQQAVIDSLPGKQKRTSNGWISFNAVCCHHNGESQDKRSRGGVITNGDAVSYHCFNCNFKTGWQPGRHITFKMRKLLTWLGVDENTRQMLNIEALRIKETVVLEEPDEEQIQVEFKSRSLPEGATSTLPDFVKQYAQARALPTEKLMYANTRAAGMWKRVIVPFTWQGETIGFSARSTDNAGRPKYFTNHDTGYVYGIDSQHPNSRFVIVTEGLLDALCIGGVGILSNQCSEQQAQIIDTLAREVILVPDRDRAGQKLIDDALEYGWSVSFPEWESDVKDVNDAVVRYGKLFTLKSIIDGKQTNSLKINLLRKKLG